MGSNMAECHPVAFRWPMKAKLNGAKLIHVDPRFTRTSAVADLHVPIRAGSDIALLGGLINYVINSRRWNTEPFFKEFVVNYPNAATIIAEGKVHQDGGDAARELGSRPDQRVRLRGGLDPAHLRGPDDQLLRAAPVAARQRRPAGRRGHGAAGTRLDPGLDGRADAVPQH